MTDPVNVLYLFEQANPAPTESLPALPMDADAYLQHVLAAPDRQNVGVTGGEHPVSGPDLSKPDRSRWLYAAAVLVLLALGWMIVRSVAPSSRVITEPTVPTTASTVPSEPTTTLPADSTTTTLSAEEEAWQAITPWVASFGEAGEYRSTHFEPEITFSVPEGWTRVPGASELPNGVTPMIRPGAVEPEGLSIYRHADDESVDAWLARMQNHDSVSIGSVNEATLGQAEAIEVRFEMVDSMVYIMLTDQIFHQLNAGEAGVAWVAEIDGHVVSALVLADSSADLVAFEAESRPVIDSISWRALRANG